MKNAFTILLWRLPKTRHCEETRKKNSFFFRSDEAIQKIHKLQALLDCFATLAMTNRKFLIVPLFIAVAAALFLAGCYNTKEWHSEDVHTRDEALAYLQEFLGDSAVTVSESYRDGVDQYDFQFRTWEADYKGLAFTVTSKQTLVYGGGGLELAKRYYDFYTDYYYMAAKALFEAYEGEKDLIQIDDYMNYAHFMVAMNDRAGFDRAYTQAKGFYDFAKEHDESLPFRFFFTAPGYLRRYSSYQHELSFRANTLSEATRNEVLGAYCVYMNTYLAAGEFTEAEIVSNITDYGRRFKVTKGETVYTFADLNLMGSRDECLSYETMYEVLIRCGFEVTGEKDDYSFIGADGSVYAISQKYYVELREGMSSKECLYYYLKDGERVEMRETYGDGFYIEGDELLTLTGMTIEEIPD
jgi:hypothetical protein